MKDSDDKLQNLVGFISASTHRQKILAALKEGSKTISQLSDETGMYSSHISSTLKELEGKGLVKCVTPNQRKGKIFVTTEKVREISSSAMFQARLAGWFFESKIAKAFDNLSIPYQRNTVLEARGHRIRPDFVITENFRPKIIVEAKCISTATGLTKELRESAFSMMELKTAKKGLKTMLILGGLSKKEIMRTPARSFVEGNYYDVVLHMDDLESIKNKNLDLKKLSDVKKHCVKWPQGQSQK